ncbi:MAG: CoA ester lyase [Cycloclasticus sp.]|nr:MAG: CoA ester lyase [Cycloclasticus sp.]
MSPITSLQRSVLFVQGSHQHRIEKSVAIPADVLVFDLEDAVSPSEKECARRLVIDALKSTDFANRQCVVRINGVTTPWFKDDVAALREIQNCAIMLPKCECAGDLVQLKTALKGHPATIYALVESALGVFSVGELAKNLNAGDKLCFGHLDFATDMGLTNTEPSIGSIHYARNQVAIAACAFNVSAIDCLTLEMKNEAVIRQDVIDGMNLGFQGKLCIHPYQVDIVNEVYTPTKEQLLKANRILDEWEKVKADGQSVFTYENKMVDLPVVHAQQNILSRYNAIISSQS